MEKISWQRIYQRADGTVIKVGLSPKYTNDPSLCPHPEGLENLPFITINPNEYPEHQTVEQLFVEDNKVKCDVNWERNLMPTTFVLNKAFAKNQELINEELKKENPDLNTLTLLRAKNDKINYIYKTNNEEEIFKVALKGLDERVANGESDKPIIRQKLLERIGG